MHSGLAPQLKGPHSDSVVDPYPVLALAVLQANLANQPAGSLPLDCPASLSHSNYSLEGLDCAKATDHALQLEPGHAAPGQRSHIEAVPYPPEEVAPALYQAGQPPDSHAAESHTAQSKIRPCSPPDQRKEQNEE